MAVETSALTLIRTKLQPPRLPADLVRRRRLMDRLQAGLDRKLTLISAQAGAGKTTLLAQWLDECPQPSAWLSLDEHDNDLLVFVSYLIGALRTVVPGVCEKTLALLSAAQTSPLRVITSWLVNELDDLALAFSSEGDHSAPGLILALDDYQTITEPEIHKLVSALLRHLPRSVHLALATRSDAPLPLPQLRARGEMAEFRFIDLRFTPQETDAFLQGAVGREVSVETAGLLAEKAEGWIVGLRLAAISMRVLSDDEAFAQRFKGTSSGFSETGKELGIGLGTAMIASIMFSMAISGFVGNVARQADIPLTVEERSEAVLLIEDEALPAEAVEAIGQRVPNLEQLGKEAYVEGFQIALGVLVGVLLLALLVVSFIPKVETEVVAAEETKELVADVSSRRL
jgi:hypothetical protein